MAKTKLSKANYVERGYGQVEPNHLSAQRTGQIYAQLPAADGIDVLENGQFVKYDYPNGVVNFTGNGEWMLVYNEVKIYKDDEEYNDFAMIKENYGALVYSADGTPMPTGTKMVPRVFKTNVGDIFTTNTINVTEENELTVGGVLVVNSTDKAGYLETVAAPGSSMAWQVVKIYTLPDRQKAVKIMRIQ